MAVKKIELTSEQYRNLLKLVYLGHWMANSHRDVPIPELEEIENVVYSFASQFGCEELVDSESQTGQYFPSVDLEEEMDSFLEEYDDYTFWDELSWRLADRDFETRYDPARAIVMTNEEILREKDIFVQKYVKEFNAHGIDHVTVKNMK